MNLAQIESEHGVTTNSNKVAAVCEWFVLTGLKQLQFYFFEDCWMLSAIHTGVNYIGSTSFRLNQ